MALQDKNVVRTAADLEKKYNFAKLLGLTTNVEKNAAELVKVENELNNMLNSLIINLGDVLDTQSNISLWFYEGIPTTSNKPYIDWVTPADHYGDFYYDQSSGYVYEFTDLGWVLQDDLNLINAMALTNVELDVTTDHERKVYFQQPTPPYSNGDWWVLEDGTLMICQISKPSGEIYEENDFIVSSLYTATIAVKVNDTLTVLKGTVLEITEDYVKYTDLSTGGSSTIAGDNITTGTIKSNNYVANTSGTKLVLSDGTIDSKNFKIDNNCNVSVTGAITATSGSFTGSVYANDGTIGGFSLNANRLYSGSGSGCAGIGVINRDYAFWAGGENSGTAPFHVGHNGYLVATNGEFTGSIKAGSSIELTAEDGTYTSFMVKRQNDANTYCGINGQSLTFWKNNIRRVYLSDVLGDAFLNVLDDTGNVGATFSASGSSNTSDIRYKDNIKNIEKEKSINIIKSLNPIEYTYKGNNDFHRGLSAQEVEKVLNENGIKNEIYFINKEDGRYMLNYSELIPDLINSIKYQQDQIEELKKEINKLKEER